MPGSAINIKANAQEVINLKRKIDELSSALVSMQRSANPDLYDKLNNELQTTTVKYNNLRSEVNKYAKEQERVSNTESNFKQKIYESTKSINILSEKIINQKSVIKEVQTDINNLSNAYKKMSLANPQRKEMLSDLKAAKKALQEEKTALFDLQQQQSRARLEQKQLNSEFRNSISSLKENSNYIKSLKGAFGSFASSLGGIGQIFAGNMLANAAMLAGQKISELINKIKDFVGEGISMATQAQGVKRAFDGLNDPTLLDGLRKSTKGTINDLELMKAAVQAQNFGIPVQKLGGLLQFAQQRAADTGQSVDYLVDSIVTGLGRKSIKILDNLQINVAELQKRAKKTGDFMGTAIDMINEKLKEQGTYVLSAADKEQIAAAKRENAQLKVGNALLGIKVIWNEIIASAFDSIGTLSEKYLPLLVKRIEGVVNKFIDWYNTSETLRAAIGGVYVIFTAVFANIKKDVKIAIDAMGAFADVMSNIGSPAKALEAYNNFIKNFAQNTAQATLEVSKSINEAKQLAGKKMGHVTLEYTIGSSKYTPGLENTKDVDPKAEKRAQRMRDAALKLLNLQSELDSESVKQQLEYEQKLLDIEQDSFDKRYRQNQLNMAKELVSIEEFRQKMIKDQQEAAKNIYVKEHGSDTGFNFLTFNKSLLPQGLSDADIESQIKKRTDASLAAWKKGNEDIAKEQRAFADEEKLTFASQLDQQIYSIRKHYKERRDLAKGNSDLIKQIEKNESREIIEARLQAHQRQLESDAEYNQKYKELTTDRYFFESDKRKASLGQQIKDQKKIFNDLEKRVMNDPNNDELARQLREAFLRLRILNKEFEKTPEQKLAEIAGIFKEITGSLSNITGVDLSMLSNAVSGIASFATGDFIGAASSGMGIVSTFITGFISQKERQAEIQREINKLQQQYNIDLRQQNYDLISSIDYARAFKDNLEALQWLIDKGFISEVDYSAWEALVKQSDEARKNFEIAKKNSDSILSDTNKTLDSLYKDFVKGSAGDAIGNQAKPIISILKDWKNGIIDNEEAFRRLGATGWKGMSDIADKIARSDEETQKWTDQIAELSQQMDEFATGTSFDSFLSDAANAISELRGNVTSLADFTEEKLTNAILSSFKYQILSNALKPMYDDLADMFRYGNIDASAANDWKQRLTDILNTNSKELDKIFSAFGIDPKEVGSSSQTPSSGYSVSMSQDTGDKLVGIATGSQMRLISLDQNVARIAQWNQPVSEKFNFDTIAMPLGALSQSSLRIERMMEENRNIQMQMFYKVSDIEKWSRVLPQMNEVLGQMNGKLDNI